LVPGDCGSLSIPSEARIVLLAEIERVSVELGQISAAGIKDQELAIIAEGAGINHSCIARKPSARIGDGHALIGPALMMGK